jgi:hypothetical protein
VARSLQRPVQFNVHWKTDLDLRTDPVTNQMASQAQRAGQLLHKRQCLGIAAYGSPGVVGAVDQRLRSANWQQQLCAG